jgi:hypothetical protein
LGRRRACGRDFRFESDALFEAAVYRLDFEGKIDFVAPHEVRFRLDRFGDDRPALAAPVSPVEVLSLLEAALADAETSELHASRLMRLALRLDPDGTQRLLDEAVAEIDHSDRRRLERLVLVLEDARVNWLPQPAAAVEVRR